MEPGCYIQWCAQTLGYGRCEQRGVVIYLRFVLVKSFGAEALVPNSAPLVVKGFVAGGNDGGSGEQEVVEGGFSTSATGAVDLSHC